MTMPGSDLLIKCPKCGNLYKIKTWLSRNDSGGKYWTDGKCEAFMMPEGVSITICEKCGTYFWTWDSKANYSFIKSFFTKITSVRDKLG